MKVEFLPLLPYSYFRPVRIARGLGMMRTTHGCMSTPLYSCTTTIFGEVYGGARYSHDYERRGQVESLTKPYRVDIQENPVGELPFAIRYDGV